MRKTHSSLNSGKEKKRMVTEMTGVETKAYKAKQLRFKKPIARNLNLDKIREDLWDMQEKCADVHYFDDDLESLVNALNGDEDEAQEFKLSFADLDADLDRFQSELEETYVTDYFDLLFPAVGADFGGGYLGFDTYEGDYFGLEPFEYAYAESEAAKKLMSLTKKELLEIVGVCLKVAYQFMAIRYRFDCLDAAIETLRGANMDKIKAVKSVEELYEKAEAASYHFQFKYTKEIYELDKQLKEIPQEYWVA